ncbi:MAG TPA: SGNH/GDSL hydrolase family protein [Terrimicrobiaceae bacterium]|nr:SGNH/GDSL hydrolase family protein [Terrimicrobiaceae bacterium]
MTSTFPLRLPAIMPQLAGILFALPFSASFGFGQGAKPEQGAAPMPPAITDQSGLPGVLLIGDSICQGYTPAVRKLLQGQANVHYGGGGPTAKSLAEYDALIGGGKWAVIHFNWGLHDLKHWKDGQMDLSAPQVATVDVYEKNLRELIGRLQKTGARLVWASTTPVPKGANGRVAGDEVIYNAAAARVMADAGIPINDLHAAAMEKPELQRVENVHFTDEGSAHLGEKVAAAIKEQLAVSEPVQ